MLSALINWYQTYYGSNCFCTNTFTAAIVWIVKSRIQTNSLLDSTDVTLNTETFHVLS